ncbi:MAG TPA: Ig-like domain-containing protein, partial [Candidatus Nitrosocosmicus sp.]|nr:Ig-like domain-containing protein [Candidatus Nitrosocosmicus sp.]
MGRKRSPKTNYVKYVLIGGIGLAIMYAMIQYVFLNKKNVHKSKASEPKSHSVQWENRGKFHSITGDQFQDSTLGTVKGINTSNNLFDSAIHKLEFMFNRTQVAPTNTPLSPRINQNNKYIDFVFISQGYSDKELVYFHNEINSVLKYFINNIEPFKSRSEQIRFNYIDNMDDLDCSLEYDHLICNTDKVINRVAQSKIPWSNIFVFVNNSNPLVGAAAHSRQRIAVLPNNFFIEVSFPHELGHSFAQLMDEYPIKETRRTFPLDGKVHANCFAGTPPAPEWNNLVAQKNYVKGCSSPHYYRPYTNSLMNDSYTSKFYNAPSQEIIRKEMDRLVGKSADTEKPQVKIDKKLSDRNYYNGRIVFAVSVSDNIGIIRVEYWKDGILYDTQYQPSYSFVWDTTKENDGRYTIEARAYDANGNVGKSSIMDVEVNNTILTPTYNPKKTTVPAMDIRDTLNSFFNIFNK